MFVPCDDTLIFKHWCIYCNKVLKLTGYGVRVEVPGSFCDIKNHGDKLAYPGWQFAEKRHKGKHEKML